jgi:hypothetical protein
MTMRIRYPKLFAELHGEHAADDPDLVAWWDAACHSADIEGRVQMRPVQDMLREYSALYRPRDAFDADFEEYGRNTSYGYDDGAELEEEEKDRFSVPSSSLWCAVCAAGLSALLFGSPEVEAAEKSAAAQGTPAARSEVALSAATLIPVSQRHATRIAVRGGRIARFISDPAQLEVRHDAATGAVFVVPLTRESASLFLITESAETFSLMLAPREKLPAQTLELRPREEARFAPRGLAREEHIQEIIRMIPNLNTAHALDLPPKTFREGRNVARRLAVWLIEGLHFEKWRLEEHPDDPIYESNLWEPDVLGVAFDPDPEDSSRLRTMWIIRKPAS